MSVFNRVESARVASEAIYEEVVAAGDGWMRELQPGQVLRIVDLEGNQAADTLFYDADNPEDHYSAVATIAGQGNIYLTTGSVLRSESGKPLVQIVADTCGRHDTVGGSCSAQSNTVRYAHEKLHMHNCRDTFMLELSKQQDVRYTKRDLAPNVNFFMNVPVTEDGGLTFADGVSSPGAYVEMQAVARTMVLLSNCPQLNNPCNAYNPTPVKMLIWER
ncbi:urea carboxylase-associated protein 1 [Paenibacillus curdlanolyticus YK9]|uniref:Urea carboxylase-associated protein 1 n=1 Tax=Paenibacillus curdlanolyticus YK9 TaxID=717606 RepID=E0I928_9BACL|nr:urea amidolyase associated protein UAAP2 [Paenibacillus curdlanolyticus]EFM10912.1 urea carboxylase-associated protein 1 [Paenibacillus curdlanolyticus YK9]